jgi:hypothetical protein
MLEYIKSFITNIVYDKEFIDNLNSKSLIKYIDKLIIK